MSDVLHPVVRGIWRKVTTDIDVSPNMLTSADRKQAYENEEFRFVGICVEAIVEFRSVQGGVTGQFSLETVGLWGVEDDSGDEHFDEIARDELDELRAKLNVLHVAGVDEAIAEFLERLVRT